MDQKKLKQTNQSKTREINVLKAERDFYRDLSQKYAELFDLLLWHNRYDHSDRNVKGDDCNDSNG